MRKSIIFIAFLLLNCGMAGARLQIDAKDSLLNVFKETEDRLYGDIEGLTDPQVNFKADTASWSIAQCLDHITKTEKMLLASVEELVEQPANPEKRAEIKGKDSDVLMMLQDRSKKFKASGPVVPDTKTHKLSDVLDAFKQQRMATLTFIAETSMEDLRNHITQGPTKQYTDAYRMLLFIAGHCLRHTEQLEDVKSAPGFPKE